MNYPPIEPAPAAIFLPRIRSRTRHLGRQTTVGLSALVTRPFVAELILAYEFVTHGQSKLLCKGDLKRIGITPAQLHDTALRTLRTSDVAFDCHGDSTFRLLSTQGHPSTSPVAACSLLLPGVWTRLAESMGDAIVVSAPTETTVLVSRRDSPTGMSLLRHYTKEAFAAEPQQALSCALLAWNGSGWEVVTRNQSA